MSVRAGSPRQVFRSLLPGELRTRSSAGSQARSGRGCASDTSPASRRHIAVCVPVAGVDARWTFWLIHCLDVAPNTPSVSRILGCQTLRWSRCQTGCADRGLAGDLESARDPGAMAMQSPPLPPAP